VDVLVTFCPTGTFTERNGAVDRNPRHVSAFPTMLRTWLT
jgi:hypothetical protein